MLNATIRKVNANMSSVTCHWVENVVSGLAVAMSCWMMPANCVAHDGTPAIQPIVEAQPAAYERDFCREGGANSETQSVLTMSATAYGDGFHQRRLVHTVLSATKSMSVHVNIRHQCNKKAYLLGAIEAISAIDAIRASMNSQTTIVVQMRPAVPPLNRPDQLERRTHSHVACRIVTNPTIETNLKFL